MTLARGMEKKKYLLAFLKVYVLIILNQFTSQNILKWFYDKEMKSSKCNSHANGKNLLHRAYMSSSDD